MLEIIFYLSIFSIFYVYAGYPLLVYIGGRIFNKNIAKNNIEPFVSILIAAHNEEDCLEATLKNKLGMDYPKDKLEIIVISDGSTDKTDEIVKKFKHQGVKLITQSPRAGKTAALNLAVPQAKGDILVFSDANSIYAIEALKYIVANFHDQKVGYVSGKMVYTNPEGTPIGDGCSAYMKYENFLRSMETQLGSVVGVDGGIDAMRKSIYSKLNPDQLPDFVQPLKVVEQGYRVVYESKALLKESCLSFSSDEYLMRVRVSLRALWAIKDIAQLLFGKGGLVFAWQLWSHKVLRYLCFIFLMGAYVTNVFLWPEMFFYKTTLVVQTVCYVVAFISLFLERNNYRVKFFFFFHYFLLLNIASAHAFIKFILGKKQVVWTPRKG